MEGQLVSAVQLAAALGLGPSDIELLVQLGLVEPIHPDQDQFAAASVVRLRRVLRLHHDLDMDLEDAAIVVDLIERLEHLEASLRRMRGDLPETGEGNAPT